MRSEFASFAKSRPLSSVDYSKFFNFHVFFPPIASHISTVQRKNTRQFGRLVELDELQGGDKGVGQIHFLISSLVDLLSLK